MATQKKETVKKNFTTEELLAMLAKKQAGEEVTIELEAPTTYRSAKIDPTDATNKVRAEAWRNKLSAYVKTLRFALEGNFKDESGNIVRGRSRGGIVKSTADSVTDDFAKIRSRLSRFGSEVNLATIETQLTLAVVKFEENAHKQLVRAKSAIATLNEYLNNGCKGEISKVLNSLGFTWSELNGTTEDMETDGQTDKERIAEAAESAESAS